MSRILVIDDELPIRRLLRILLEGAGHEVICEADASHGLHALALQKPDLLILDLGLPYMDGLKVLHHLREWSGLPVLVLSARYRRVARGQSGGPHSRHANRATA
jgi:two-component system KDP operon response regulator KdpE